MLRLCRMLRLCCLMSYFDCSIFVVSGHSKWATIKHKKGATDAKRGKLFATLIKQVEVAARSGGGDLDANPTLRTMYQKARDNSVPLDTIERAVKRGTGELEGVNYEFVTYEGYAPGGVALYIECLTDNRNRTGGDVRSTLTRNGGSLAEPGSVAWQFQRKGLVMLSKTSSDGTLDEEALMLAVLDAGAEDIVDAGDYLHVVTEPGSLETASEALKEAEIPFDSADVTMIPTITVAITEIATAKKVLYLLEQLDNLDDVQEVHTNFDVKDQNWL